MRVLVIGGGIGGLTAAAALQQRGLDAHVYEAAPALAPVGAGIWVPANAMQALTHLGLDADVAAAGIPLGHAEVRDADFGSIQTLDFDALRPALGHTSIAIHRARLQAVLVDALAPGTLHLGRTFTRLEDDGARITAHFADGTTATGDVLVGADGLRSAVRSLLVPAARLRYSGQTCFRGVARMRPPAGMERAAWEVWGGAVRFGFSPIAEEAMYWFAPCTAPAGTQEAPEAVAAALPSRYAAFPDPIPAIARAAAAAPETIIQTDLYDVAPIDRWWSGRAVLLGDAAHAATPNLGQGGAQAIEDALVLARCLAEHEREDTPDAAFTAFERHRRPKALRVVAGSWRMGRLAHTEPRLARRLLRLALRAVPDSLTRRALLQLYTFA